MTYSIILASGVGSRAKSELPKQFLKIAGKSVIEHTISVFENHPDIDNIILVVHPAYIELMEEYILRNNYRKVKKLLSGGKTRQESSYIGLSAIKEEESKVLIHDAVRPFLNADIISNCIRRLDTFDAVDVAIPSADTIINIDDNFIISRIPPRKYIMRGQTPQGFKVGVIKRAHLLAKKDRDEIFTDDCGLIIKYNLAQVSVVIGEESNIKITHPIDVSIADKLFQMRSSFVDTDRKNFSQLNKKVMLIFGVGGIGTEISNSAKKNGAIVHEFTLENNQDINDVEQIEAFVEKVYSTEGRIDYCVHTAGVLSMGKVESRANCDIENEVNTNYTSVIYLLKIILPHLRQAKGGFLSFTSSSYTRGRKNYAIYSSSKAALVNLTQAVAEEVWHDGVNINIINPERAATPMRLKNFGKEPANTLLSPVKVAETALSVLLDKSITGQVIDVRK